MGADEHEIEPKLAEGLRRASERERRGFVLGIQLDLARLGYFLRPFSGELDRRTFDALRKYKSDSGLPPGEAVLDEAVYRRLDEDLQAFVEPPGLMPYLFTDDGRFVYVAGTWQGQGMKIAHASQTTQLQCYRDGMFCVEATASVDDDGSPLFVDLIVHTIDTWGDREITTVPDRAACAYSVLKLNRATSRVSRTRTTTSTEGLCRSMEADDFHVHLVDGEEVWLPVFRARRARLAQVLGVEDLVEPAEAAGEHRPTGGTTPGPRKKSPPATPR